MFLMCWQSNVDQKKRTKTSNNLWVVTPPGMERNTPYASLQELDRKLEELGLVEVGGEITCLTARDLRMIKVVENF